MPLVATTQVEPKYIEVLVTNNGQVDLIVNNVQIPARPMDTDTHRIRALNNELVIRSVDPKSPTRTIKLTDTDAGTLIKIGGQYNPSAQQYVIDIRRPYEAPVRMPLNGSLVPKKL